MIERRLLIRCDGGNIPEIGTGHVRRCLALAAELLLCPGTSLVFLMRPTPWLERVRDAGHTVLALDETDDLDEQLVQVARECDVHVVFLDNLDQSVGAIPSLQAEGRIVISMDDPSACPQADISVAPAFPGRASTHVELDRTIFLDPLRARSGGGACADILASFGGYDPGGLALKFLRAWCQRPSETSVLVALGSECPDLTALQEIAEDSENVEVATEIDLVQALSQAELAITNGGTTLFLAAALGTPSLCVAQYPHQTANSRRVEVAGATRYLGAAQDFDPLKLVDQARDLLADPSRREAMSFAGRVLFPGLGKRELAQTLSVVERLEWDSNFFGMEIATLHPRRLTERILLFAEKACRAVSIQCLYFLADGSHEPTRVLAEQHGFRAVDDRLTYLRTTEDLPQAAPPPGVEIRTGLAADGAQLAQIAGTSYGASRYFHDGRFPKERCEQFYRDWIQKSLEGRFDDEVLVAVCEGQVAGYISCRANTANLGSIGLVGLDADFRARGIGSSLVQASLTWFEERDIPRIEVVTQGRNVAAQKLYESCGFVLHRVEKWYHNWLDEDRNQA